jgi:hypothetical protein
MKKVIYPQDEGEPVVVKLHDPYWAAFLAWLWPGAGHFYQRRFAKGFLFMICILGTFFFGLGLGHGRVVYSSYKQGDFRWHYFCQFAVGLPALPALVQSFKTSKGNDPFFVLCERYPGDYGDETSSLPDEKRKVDLRYRRITEENNVFGYNGPTLKDGFMAPPAGPVLQDDPDVLGRWHFEYKHNFEMGTLYTVIAGLLNLLAIYDAFVGPAILTPMQKEKLENKKKGKSKSSRGLH